jgi:hypothetical protein
MSVVGIAVSCTAFLWCVPGASAAVHERPLVPTECPSLTGDDTAVGNDVNGDRVTDTVYGGDDSVSVRYAGVGSAQVGGQEISPSDIPLHFGAAVDYADLNGDGCADLVVGAPDLNKVYLLFGPVWPGSVHAVAITEPDASAGDRFGASVALGEHGFSNPNPTEDLWIGAPGESVNGHAHAGVVYHYTVDATGTATLQRRISEASGLIHGLAQPGDHFGAVLSGGQDGVAVGVPDKTVGHKSNAGALVRLELNDATGSITLSPRLTQDSPGVGGAPGAGNRFGASVAGGGVAVGVPGARVGRHARAGAVQTFRATGKYGSGLKPAHYYTQNSPRVPGSADSGDRFGAAVTTGTFTCQEADQVAIGSPGENVGSAHNAGSVTLIALRSDEGKPADCPRRLLYAGHGLGGAPRSGAETGLTLSTVRDEYQDDEDAIEHLLVAVPGATVDGRTDAGVVQLWTPTFGTKSSHTTVTEPSGPVRNARFGTVLPAH